jgi:hypothetical protein
VSSAGHWDGGGSCVGAAREGNRVLGILLVILLGLGAADSVSYLVCVRLDLRPEGWPVRSVDGKTTIWPVAARWVGRTLDSLNAEPASLSCERGFVVFCFPPPSAWNGSRERVLETRLRRMPTVRMAYVGNLPPDPGPRHFLDEPGAGMPELLGLPVALDSLACREEVVVKLHVDSTGSVCGYEPADTLTPACRRAIADWVESLRFRPARWHGRPVWMVFMMRARHRP